MKLNEKKETLLKKLREVNNEVFTKIHDGECFHDITGNDFDHFWEAMRYVPNRVIKKWIKDTKHEAEIDKRVSEESPEEQTKMETI